MVLQVGMAGDSVGRVMGSDGAVAFGAATALWASGAGRPDGTPTMWGDRFRPIQPTKANDATGDKARPPIFIRRKR